MTAIVIRTTTTLVVNNGGRDDDGGADDRDDDAIPENQHSPFGVSGLAPIVCVQRPRLRALRTTRVSMDRSIYPPSASRIH
eukprot:9497093-Lingulodinium_polyedra.AAC.1